MKTIAKGSIYQVEIETIGSKVVLIQDNNQRVVIHFDDISHLMKILKEIQKND